MPIRIVKLKSGKYRVYDGKRISARSTTKKKAKSQGRLLQGLSHKTILRVR